MFAEYLQANAADLYIASGWLLAGVFALSFVVVWEVINRREHLTPQSDFHSADWKGVDVLRLWQAASLWENEAPTSYEKLSPRAHARLSRLIEAGQKQKLDLEISDVAKALLEMTQIMPGAGKTADEYVDENTRISPAALRRYAEKVGEAPEFLEQVSPKAENAVESESSLPSWVPIWKAIEHVAEVLGDADEDQVYLPTRKALREKAIDGALNLRGRSKLREELNEIDDEAYDPDFETIPQDFWRLGELNAFAPSPLYENVQNNASPKWIGEEQIGTAYYKQVQADMTEIEKLWPKN
ncbi:MAG: hypothetical protein P1U84_13270 [Parvibaculaceae bacterium]|nr:hypothetical protein [Parvibaculaceae bacterium]